VSQDEWDAQRKQIASDTEITIQSSREAIEKATTEAKKALKKLEDQKVVAEELAQDNQKKYETSIIAYEQWLKDLEHDIKVASRTNANLQEENRNLISDIEVRKDSVSDLKRQEEGLSGQIAELKIQDEQAADHLVELRKQEQALEKQIEELKADFNREKADIEHELTILQAKLSDLQQEILSNRQKDEKVRDNLAQWAKNLEAQDQNIRIREEKLSQQQSAIARNYNLLNL